MSSEKITQDLLQAISIVAQQAVNKASYDKTIQATIISCVDATIGKYKVKYQDGYWYAYSISTDVSYSVGTTVYVLVPGGDMSKEKTILGTAKKLGINYVNVLAGSQGYSKIGGNTIVSTEEVHNFCSYESQEQVLYKSGASNNKLQISTELLQSYLKTATHIILSATVQTALPLEQRQRGNYGLIFDLIFYSNADKEVQVHRQYILDVDVMTGNPYMLVNPTQQEIIAEIDGENFVKIDSITAFVKNFPNQQAGHPADIFLSNISLIGAATLTEQERNGVALCLNFPYGQIFPRGSSSDAERPVQAEVRVKMQTVDYNSQSLSFYWFVENTKITSDNKFYNKYGGQGWRCLNSYRPFKENLDQNKQQVEFVPAKHTYTVKKSDVLAQNLRYKCVVIYDGKVLSKEFVMQNWDAQYEVTVTSDAGNDFAYDIGRPTLTCNVKLQGQDVNPNDYQYVWSVTNNLGTYSTLPTTIDQNVAYSTALRNYLTLKDKIDNHEVLPKAYYSGTKTNEQKLIELATDLKDAEIPQRVDKNHIYRVEISNIVNFSVFKCSVFYQSQLVGTDSILLTNQLENTGLYTLVINNGSQVFNYSVGGVAPTNQSFEQPYVIPALSFTIYDNKGNALEEDVVKYSEVFWKVPAENTMITVSNAPAAQNGYYIFHDLTLTYDITNKYYVNRTNNDIQLQVNYNGLNLVAKTDLTFTKQGDIGTNGTEYQVKLVPYVQSGTAPDYPVIIKTGNTITTNWTHSSTRWFDIELWHNGQRIFKSNQNGTALGKPVTVSWSVLKNKYKTIEDKSWITINGSTGVITFNTSETDQIPANIIKATVTYDNFTYYVTLPLITMIRNNASYEAYLKKNTGFRYVLYDTNGKTPSYDNHAPFEVITKAKLSNGNWDDISLTKVPEYVVTYNWSYINRYYQYSGTTATAKTTNLQLFEYGDQSELQKNQRRVKPVDEYDGLTVNNAVVVNITIANGETIKLHIPVHFYLNRYWSSAINGWDGNSIDLGGDTGMILAPQVGAGIKEQDNSFTGVVIGKSKSDKDSPNDTDVGLFGYAKGARSIFLDANTGKAEFGIVGKSRLIIDPSNNKAELYSGNYKQGTQQTGSGLKIDFTTPEIRFGTGNFVVTPQGYLTAKGGGDIAGWYIDNYHFWTGNKNINSANTIIASQPPSGVSDVTRTINGQSVSNLRLFFNNRFGVDGDGNLYAGIATLGTGSNKIYLNGNGSTSFIRSGKTSYNDNYTGFYIGTDGVGIGPENKGFYTDANGNGVFRGKLQIGSGGTTGNLFVIDPNNENNNYIYFDLKGKRVLSLDSTINNTPLLTLRGAVISEGSVYKMIMAGGQLVARPVNDSNSVVNTTLTDQDASSGRFYVRTITGSDGTPKSNVYANSFYIYNKTTTEDDVASGGGLNIFNAGDSEHYITRISANGTGHFGSSIAIYNGYPQISNRMILLTKNGNGLFSGSVCLYNGNAFDPDNLANNRTIVLNGPDGNITATGTIKGGTVEATNQVTAPSILKGGQAVATQQWVLDQGYSTLTAAEVASIVASMLPAPSTGN